MGWNDEETKNVNKGMNTSSKVLLGIIACILLIIVLLIILLMNTKQTTFKIYADGQLINGVDKATLLTTIDGITYINIEQFAKIVGYEYHRGEYKSSIIENDKCYVEGDKETASFYLNDNKIYKLPINEQNRQYEEHTLSTTTKEINGVMYASIEAVSRACNVLISVTSSDFQIYTLNYLISIYNTNVTNWGYTAINEQSFENQKALLYGCLIVKKEGGLYKIIDTNNTKEIVLDRYTSIEFYENTQQFFVKDNANKMGIINLDGTTQIEPMYDSISLLSKEYGLYIVEQDKKYGVVSREGRSVIYPEYDSIGLSDSSIADNKYLMLNTLIPVCKDKKWGAFNVSGNLVFGVEYDEFGYNLTSIEIDGVKEVVQPVLTIERANGVVVKKENKYGLLDVNGRELVPIAVEGIYGINGIDDEEEKYFMLYNGEEINLIKRLIEVGLIKEKVEEIPSEDLDNTITGNNITNEVSGKIENQNSVSNEI